MMDTLARGGRARLARAAGPKGQRAAAVAILLAALGQTITALRGPGSYASAASGQLYSLVITVGTLAAALFMGHPLRRPVHVWTLIGLAAVWTCESVLVNEHGGLGPLVTRQDTMPPDQSALDRTLFPLVLVAVVALGAPLALSLVLRYPGAQLTRARRRLVTWWSSALVIAAVVSWAGADSSLPRSWMLLSIPDDTYNHLVLPPTWLLPPLGWGVGAAILTRAAVVARGEVRWTAGAAAIVTAAAAAAWTCAAALILPDQINAPLEFEANPSSTADALSGLGDTCQPALVLVPVVDVVRRRLAAARTTEQVLAAAADGCGPQLDAAVGSALGDPGARVLPLGDEATGHGADPRNVHNLPVRRGDGSPLAILQCHFGAGYVDDPDHLAHVADGVALGLETAALRQELAGHAARLRASRHQSVEAASSERRRIERDLHDGPQQALLGVNAVLARAALTADPAGRVAALSEALSRLDAVRADLDRLADGLRPRVLDDHGLEGALSELAATAPMRVRLTLDPGFLPAKLPGAAESTAYFLVAEALANAAKHGQATNVDVRFAVQPETLAVTVVDDGQGGARPVPGGGLEGLRRRVLAAAGTFEVTSDRAGTVIRAELPLPQR